MGRFELSDMAWSGYARARPGGVVDVQMRDVARYIVRGRGQERR